MALTPKEGQPIPIFGSFSAIAVVVGIVVGIGIFRLPPLVAENADTAWQFIGFWVAGGIISILGALCYSELAALKPDAGGEYHFLSEAYGPSIGFLFSWGRMTVIQTGSIALAAFILGDYATILYNLGPYSSAIYAGITVILLTGLNLWGTGPSRRVQNVMATFIVLLLVAISIFSLLSEPTTAAAAPEAPLSSGGGSAGMAMIFVLLTYGGWNEAVYLSAELQDVKRNMVKVLVWGICIITCIYLLINLAYLHVLGLENLRASETVGATLTGELLGNKGAIFVAIIVITAALSTTNATIITGARTNYAFGRDFSLLGFLGDWDPVHNTPANALLLQGGIALLLVIIGGFTKQAITTMVDYTAPVFWFFIMLTTISLFIFRSRQNKEDIPFKVPFYPVTPILFCVATLYMLYSSLTFTGFGALLGVGILLVGIPFLLLARRNGYYIERDPND